MDFNGRGLNFGGSAPPLGTNLESATSLDGFAIEARFDLGLLPGYTRQRRRTALTMDRVSITRVRFGVFEADLQTGELWRNGLKVKIQELPFQVLASLLERQGEVVTREELRSRLWPADTFVDFEQGLNKAINKLREALGDDANNPHFVETLPRRGYRFIARVDAGAHGGHKSDDRPQVAVTRAPHLKGWWLLWAGGALAMLLAALAVTWFVRHPAGAKPELTEQRLTFNPPDNQVWSAAISPNGKYLAYSDLTGVSLRLIETGQTRKLFAIKEGAGINRVAWFPDGTRLLASGNTDPEDTGGIWVTSILGEAPRNLRADAMFAVVSPDGAQIAFVSGEDLNAIWVMGARGEEQRRIAVYEDSSIATPVWSPDGGRIAYIRMGEDTTTIESRDLNGGPAVPAVSDPRLRAEKGGLWGAALCWSPDGRIIYPMSSSQKSGETDLWAVRVDPRTGTVNGKPDRITSWGGSFFIGLDVTADGKRLAALRAHAQPGVWVGEIRENPTRLEAPRRLTVEDSDDRPFSWTPHGKAVLFSSDRDGRFHIFRQAIDQTRAEAVTAGPEDDFWPVVTPDGSWILYDMAPTSEVFRRQSHRLMRVPVSGGPPQFVADLPPDSYVRCARLPSTLCILGEPGPEQLLFYVVDPMNGRGRELTRTEATPDTEWDLSPDGSRIAVSTWDTERGRIRILDLAGSTPPANLELKGQHGLAYMAWSADGRGLFVRSFGHVDSSERRLLYVGLDGTARVLRRTIATGGPHLLTPSPDGQYLAWAENMWDGNAWMLENF
jgi:Tol biopolymer transport system component/DNA-binding winged helix-turn-helix (wHTH) protein